jgi:hypothetical protein
LYSSIKNIGGYGVFEHLKDEDTKKADQFNKGLPAILDLTKLKCPCGKPFLMGTDSTVCGACGTATCSAECHDKFMQSANKCLFSRNFADMKVQGLRGIRLENILKMQSKNMPKYSQCSIMSPNFLLAALGPSKNTLYLQRGFRIYGSPCVI